MILHDLFSLSPTSLLSSIAEIKTEENNVSFTFVPFYLCMVIEQIKVTNQIEFTMFLFFIPWSGSKIFSKNHLVWVILYESCSMTQLYVSIVMIQNVCKLLLIWILSPVHSSWSLAGTYSRLPLTGIFGWPPAFWPPADWPAFFCSRYSASSSLLGGTAASLSRCLWKILLKPL